MQFESWDGALRVTQRKIFRSSYVTPTEAEVPPEDCVRREVTHIGGGVIYKG